MRTMAVLYRGECIGYTCIAGAMDKTRANYTSTDEPRRKPLRTWCTWRAVVSVAYQVCYWVGELPLS